MKAAPNPSIFWNWRLGSSAMRFVGLPEAGCQSGTIIGWYFESGEVTQARTRGVGAAFRNEAVEAETAAAAVALIQMNSRRVLRRIFPSILHGITLFLITDPDLHKTIDCLYRISPPASFANM